jgi:predicted aspartyl protease
LGDAEVRDITVIIHDFSQDPRVEGLLGMDFLGQFHVGLDSQKQLLVLSPR